MAESGQSSFRRILLSRILLLVVPVLVIGGIVVFSKARSNLLEAAHRNLTESAVRKGESIGNAIAALKANLLVASQTTVLQEGTAKQAQQFLDRLAPQLPNHVQCVRLTNFQTGNIVASTCGKDASKELTAAITTQAAAVKLLYPPRSSSTKLLSAHLEESSLTSPAAQVQLLLSAPVYNNAGQLRYALSIQSGLLVDSTVIIAENGTILAHPLRNYVGRNIQQAVDAEGLQSIVKNAIAKRQDFRYLSFAPLELLVGYTAIPSPITNEHDRHWIVLAVTDLDKATFGLQEIKIILFLLTLGVLGASLLATLYLARDLGQPLKKLREYVLNLQSHTAKRVSHNCKIREFAQLMDELDCAEEHLKAWAEEIETACKKAQAANAFKSEFLATTSHELRTPLNAIIGCIRVVRDGCCDDQEEIEFLERADQAAIHLLRIIDDLLDIAKIEAGKLSVVSEPIDLQQVLKEVIDLQTVHIQQKCLQLVLVNLDWQEPIIVQADAAKLKQVLINVIGNAVKFTEQGSITIKTRVERAPDACNGVSKRAVVTVQDTGVGIDPEQQHKLFRPFVIVDDTTMRKFGGNGLGLAISRNLLELMGGSITLHSAGSGQGTTVELALQLTGSGEQEGRAGERELIASC